MADFTPKPQAEETKNESRDVLNRLPGFLQDHEQVKKFFRGGLNHFFEPTEQEEVSGFIGRYARVYDPNDHYVEESTLERRKYQLEAASVSKDVEGNINEFSFYEDLVDALRYQGANVENHSRLFESEYWSWMPPINPDALINFPNYFWLEEGPPVLTITENTNVVLNMIGQPTYTSSSIGELQSGMRVTFEDDDNLEYNGVNFIVEGVGRSIRLVDDSEYDTFTDTEQDYIVMERGAQDQNAWSVRNRWFHRNQIATLDLENFTIKQATRPIIWFEADIQLMNSGRVARTPVDLIHNGPMSTIQGQTSASVDGTLVEDGMRILVIGEPTEGQNNKVYKVFGNTSTGLFVLITETDGSTTDGSPAEDEVIRALNGVSYKDKRVHWDGTTWVESQYKTTTTQYPEFRLFDKDAVPLDDEGIYPGSDFTGNNLFGFLEVDTNDLDDVLNLRINFNSFGDIDYENFIQTGAYTYQVNGEAVSIDGMKFYRVNGKTSATDSYETDWRAPTWKSQQFVLDQIVMKAHETTDGNVEYERDITLSQVPQDTVPGKTAPFKLLQNGVRLNEGTDYSRVADQVQLSLTLPIEDGDVIEAKSFDWDRPIKPIEPGFYRIPSNLQANPNNANITTISYNELFEHFYGMIQNQNGLIGQPYGVNNYNSTERILTTGTDILQHSAPMLKLMFLNKNKELNIQNCIRFAQKEYTRWYEKFKDIANKRINDGTYDSATDVDGFIDTVLAEINIGKDDSIPFKNSGVIGDDLWVVPSPAFLGFSPVYAPEVFTDDTITTNVVNWRRGHDGSLTLTETTELSIVMLALEQRIYDSIDSKFKMVHPEFSHFDTQPGKFRTETTPYNREEWLNIQRPQFENWVFQNVIDYKTNNLYDVADPFTWNYSSVVDIDGAELPGHWRGIYRWFFDTDRPHTHPWEMLGLGEKPDWWDTTYGTAPYTNQNFALWNDLENGTIAGGTFAGTDTRFARPGLTSFIPVDANGLLLDPVEAGICVAPASAQAAGDFKYGDIGPMEWLFYIGNEFPFVQAMTTYLARPAEWLEKTWDTMEFERLYRNQEQTQVINSSLGRRAGSADINIHTLTNREIGSQQWISEFYLYKGLNQTTSLGNLLQDLAPQLSYRAGAFVKSDGLSITTENFGKIPDENIDIVFSQSSSRREPVYSALLITWDGTAYRIKGLDPLYPHIQYLDPNLNGNKSSFTYGDVTATLYHRWSDIKRTVEYDVAVTNIQEVCKIIQGYGAWLESEGWVFDQFISSSNEMRDWTLMAKEFIKWTDETLEVDDVLFLSPLSEELKFTATQGLVDQITQFTNGTWTALDEKGIPIRTENFNVQRDIDDVIITHDTDSSIGLMRLSLIEYEHAYLFDNVTDFDNLVYDPIINLRQKRFRLLGIRSQFWNGRLEAGGYIVTEQGMIDNFDKKSEDVRKYFDPYSIGISNIESQHAKATFGFKETTHMEDMLLDDRSQFNFYRGFLQEKGTLSSFDKLLRSNHVRNTQGDFEIFEEWAFKVGEYGGREIKTSLEFNLLQSELKQDPQTVTFTTDETVVDSKLDPIITIPMGDDRWIKTADANFLNKFTLRNFENSFAKDLPNAGPALIDELTRTVANEAAFDTVWEDSGRTLVEGNTVWVVKDDKGDWDVRRFSNLTWLVSLTAGATETDPTLVQTNAAHGLSVGDNVVFTTTTGADPDLIDTHTVTAVPSSTTFEVAHAIGEDVNWYTTATATVTNPAPYYGETLGVNATNILFTTTNTNDFSTAASPAILNLGGLTLTVDGDTVTFAGNVQTGLITNPKLNAATNTSVQMKVDGYPVTFELNNVVGSVINPTVTVDAATGMYINGTDVVWTGAGDLDSIVNDINTAAITDISAEKTGSGNNQLKIIHHSDDIIDLRSVGVAEDALEQLGFAFNTSVTGTNTSPTVTVDASNGININGTAVVWTGAGDTAAMISDIDGAAISNISTANVGGALQITHDTGGDIYIFNVDATEDSVEVIGFTQTEAATTTAEIVSTINDAVDSAEIIATDSSGKVQIEKVNGGELTFEDVTDAPLSDLGFQTLYAARTATDVVSEMTGAGMAATYNTTTEAIDFSYAATSTIAVSGTAITQLELESSYQAALSFTEVDAQIAAVNIPDVTYEQTDGVITFKNVNSGALTFSGVNSTFGLTSVGAGSAGPDLYGWHSQRRANVAAVTGTAAPTDGWITGDLAFVDRDTETNIGITVSTPENSLWSVWEYNGSWALKRYEEDKIATDLIESVYLVDNITEQTTLQVDLWDPYKAIIPGTAMSEIFYQLEIDPAVYTNGPGTDTVVDTERSWGIEHKDRLWWDLDAVRYLDYEQGGLEYRRKYWGRKLAGSSIDVYEWTRSPVPPTEWADFVTEQEGTSNDYKPSGTVKNADDPSWSERVEYDVKSGQNITYYYFWVKDVKYKPNHPNRERSAKEVARIIDSPLKAGVTYLSPIETLDSSGIYTNSFVIGNIVGLITDDDAVVQMNFHRKVDDDKNIHKQWILTKEGDDNSIDSTLWAKMKYSIIGEDATGLALPDTSLNESRRYGTQIRPRQSMFKDRESARRTMTDVMNRILLKTNIVDIDPDWMTTFEAKDPEPTSYDTVVTTRAERDALTTNPLFEAGDTVLVQEDEEDKNKWSHWSWDGATFTLLDKEEYDATNYWAYTDWYDEDIDQATPPTKTFTDLTARNAGGPFVDQEIVLVLDNGEGRWTWTRYNEDDGSSWWNTVAVESGTVQLGTSIYSFDLTDTDLELETKIIWGLFIDYFELK